MNDIDKNRINRYIYRYSIKDTAENFNKIAEVITKRESFIYHKILYMIDNCHVVEEDSTGLTVEICMDELDIYWKILQKTFSQRKLAQEK